MAHAGKQIVDAFETVVKAAGSEASGTVSQRRFFPQSDRIVADAIVYGGDEDVAPISQAPLMLEREMIVAIKGRFRGEADQLEARGWAFQEALEQAVADKGDFGGLAQLVVPLRTSTEISGESDTPLLIRTIEFAVTYWTRNGAPETAL